MKVLLWHDIDNLGKRGEVVEVRDGYARNWLFPRKIASLPTPSRYRELDLDKRRLDKQEAVLISEAKQVAAKLTEIGSVSVEVRTTEEGQLYGAVNPSMIADALRDKGIKIEPRVVDIPAPIKQVGTYDVMLNLHRETKVALKVWVLSTKAVKPEPAAAKPAEESKPEAPPAN